MANRKEVVLDPKPMDYNLTLQSANIEMMSFNKSFIDDTLIHYKMNCFIQKLQTQNQLPILRDLQYTKVQQNQFDFKSNFKSQQIPLKTPRKPKQLTQLTQSQSRKQDENVHIHIEKCKIQKSFIS